LISLEGKVALVTGGSRGIGAACCRMLARAGCDVAVNYRRQGGLAQAVATEIEAMGRRALPVAADVMNPLTVEAMIRRVAEDLGGPDILVNNAGIWTAGPIETMTDADWARMIGVNLTGIFHTCRSTVPFMKARGGGSIVNIASTSGQRGEAGDSHYSASKGGMIAMSKSLALELAPFGIRVNVVSPGWIRTDMTAEELAPDRIEVSLKEPIPLGHPGDPEDVAGPVVFLCSSLARHITGATLNVNGGAVLV
jgi:3-oxoacyl-[acyl-carrier protein] reductase